MEWLSLLSYGDMLSYLVVVVSIRIVHVEYSIIIVIPTIYFFFKLRKTEKNSFSLFDLEMWRSNCRSAG